MKYVIHKADDGQFYFTQVADNGEVVTTSETYTRKADAERGAWDAAGTQTIHVVDATEEAE